MLRQITSHSLQLTLMYPEVELSHYVQCIWAATVADTAETEETRQLFSDGCSGLVFILNGDVLVDGEAPVSRVYLQPTTQISHQVTLCQGAKIAGVRFQPGVATALFQQVANKNMNIDHEFLTDSSSSLFAQLTGVESHSAMVDLLAHWVQVLIDRSNSIPPSLLKALEAAQQQRSSFLSQRQVERQFKQWVGITPKHYQRILRVRRSLDLLKSNPTADLADLAIKQGFADQAHMTREFKRIAKVTPKRYSRRYKQAKH